MKKELEVTLQISREKYEEMNKYLENGYDLTTHHTLSPESTLFSTEAPFEEGRILLEVFTGESSVMCSVYIYDNDGSCDKYIESDAGIDAYYEYETEDKIYKINVDIID